MSAIVLTCPACSTRYRATADSLGLNGRTVRCARCNETWFEPSRDFVDPAQAVAKVSVDPDALAHADNVQRPLEDDHGPNPAPVESPTPLKNPDPIGVSGLSEPSPDRVTPNESTEADTPSTDQDNVLAPPAPPVGADVMMRDHVDQIKLKRRRRTITFIWLVPLIIVVLAAIIAWTQRQAIVNRIPQMATLYQAIGVEVRAGGLKMDPPSASMVDADGVRVLRIQSVIHNLTDEAKTVPLIELMLHNEMGETLTQWYVETAETEIGRERHRHLLNRLYRPP